MSSAWTIPILETERLRLRAHTLADFPAYCALWADPHTPPHPPAEGMNLKLTAHPTC